VAYVFCSVTATTTALGRILAKFKQFVSSA
jgi:hypothetical protein